MLFLLLLRTLVCNTKGWLLHLSRPLLVNPFLPSSSFEAIHLPDELILKGFKVAVREQKGGI